MSLRSRMGLMSLVLQSRTDQRLEFLKLAHEWSRLSSLHLALALQLLILISQSGHLLAKIRSIISYNTPLSLHTCSLTSIFLGLLFILHLPSIGVHASKMLVQILLSRETFAGESLAIWMWTVELLSRAAM
jgi:hypothetical protein